MLDRIAPRLVVVPCLIVIGLTLLLAADASAGGGPDKRKCGVLPGEGAYNYVKTRNVSCKQARKVGRRAGRKFCAHSDRCSGGPTAGIVKGHVKAKGWRCTVKMGWEFFQARCHRRDASFLLRSGA
jgi:hypothetical protein